MRPSSRLLSREQLRTSRAYANACVYVYVYLGHIYLGYILGRSRLESHEQLRPLQRGEIRKRGACGAGHIPIVTLRSPLCSGCPGGEGTAERASHVEGEAAQQGGELVIGRRFGRRLSGGRRLCSRRRRRRWWLRRWHCCRRRCRWRRLWSSGTGSPSLYNSRGELLSLGQSLNSNAPEMGEKCGPLQRPE